MTVPELWRHSIYVLSGSDMVVRYVGRTKTHFEERLYNHMQAAKRGSRPLHKWLIETGDDLVMREIERFMHESREYCHDACMAERRWVKYYAEAGNDLFNVHYLPKPGGGPRIITLEDQEMEMEQAA